MRGRKGSCSMAASVSLLLLFLISILYVAASPAKPAKTKIYYIDPEHINLTYWNPKCLRDPIISTRRFKRSDPVHYINIHAEVLVPIGNNVLIEGYVYEFLSNEYRRSFVEFKFKTCDMLSHAVFGPILTLFLPTKTCPIPKGIYDLQKISFPDLPILRTFPFQKGRIFLNTTITGSDGVRERLYSVYFDVVIKQR